MSSASLDPDLMRAIGFTAADLEANRQGMLTEFQRRAVVNRRSLLLKIFGFVTFLLIGVTILGFYAFIDKGIIQESFWVLGSLVLATLVWIVACMLEAKKHSADLKAMKVNIVSGKITMEQRLPGSGRAMLHFLKIEDFEIKVDHETFLHFELHEPYTLYYTPNTKVLVAAEPILQEQITI